MKQRRRFLRKALNIKAKLINDGSDLNVTIIELSGEGCVMISKDTIPVNFQLEFEFAGSVFNVSSERVWNREKKGNPQYGVRFNIDSKTRSLIVDEILNEILKKC